MMNKVLILRVGSNFYDKPEPLEPLDIEDGGYKTEVFFDKDTFEKIIDEAKGFGFDTVMLNLGEGIVYDSHPEIAIKGSMPKAEFKKYLDKIKALGMKIAPMLDFSAVRNAWMGEYCTTAGSLLYKDVCCDLLREVLELFEGPELCHLGFEAETYEKQSRNPVITKRRYETLYRDMNALFDICNEFGTRPIIWVDEETVTELGGKVVKVLVEGYSKTDDNMLTGRTENGKIVNFAGDESNIGKIIDVEITEVATWSLKGKIVKEK